MSASAPLWRLSRNAERCIELLLLAAFVAVALLYFFEFAFDFDRYAFTDRFFNLALNSHDHGVYVATIDAIARYGVEYGLNNDFGIAAIYLALSDVFPWLVNANYTVISFAFNACVLVACYWLWSRICTHYGLGMGGRAAFFVNTSLIYFMQLINKDMLTVFTFLLAVHLGATRRHVWLLLALPLVFLVRQQLAVFTVLFIYFMSSARPQKRMLLAYVITSLVAGVLSVYASVIGEDSIGEGLNAYLLQLNMQYYVGYLLFNPVRVLQYLVDAYASFQIFSITGGVDVAKILRLPTLVLLVRPLSTIVTRFGPCLQSPLKPLVVTVVAYLLAWLMNPTVNARYVVLILPVLILFALAARRARAAEPAALPT